jgi:chaperonin cofactor prefoldin
VVQHLFGKAFESVAGYNPAFDIISAMIKALGWDDEEESEDTALDNIEQGFMELMGDLPYVSTLTGGRIPIASALPIKELYNGEDQYGNEKSRWETLAEAAPYYLLPGGYGQAKKTVQGLGMFSDDHPVAGSYTGSGNLRFPVEDTLGNKVQAAIFGQWASENAREYFDNEWAPLKKNQIEEYAELGLPISEYRKIREELSKFDTLSEKANYIGNLDLTSEQKNILVNNLTDRKDPIDMTNYGNYGSFEEFDYAQKNPEKYEFLNSIGVSYEDYANADDDAKGAYNWAFENPEKYKVSKVVTDDVTVYRQYTKYISKLSADKDQYGNSISDSKKEKVAAYINELDMEYGQKIILFKSQYPADDTYNYDIVDYLSSREDVSYEDAVTILKALGFEVHDDGRVTWD